MRSSARRPGSSRWWWPTGGGLSALDSVIGVPDDYAIETQQLCKFFGDVHAVAGVALRVPRGSILGLLGPNGAGKTTTVRILTTLLSPDSGTARVAGMDVVQDADRL